MRAREPAVASSLVHNLALVVALAAGLQILAARVRHRPRGYVVLSGLLCGGVAVMSMMTPVVFAEGVIYDGRAVVLTLAGMVAGPVGAGIAAAVAAAYRLWLGGAGAAVGVTVIMGSAATGAGVWSLRRRQEAWGRPLRIMAVGFAVAVGTLALQGLVPGIALGELFQRMGPVLLIGYPLALLVAASVFLEGERRLTAEHDRSLALQGADLSTWTWDLDTGRVRVDDRSAERLGYRPREPDGSFDAHHAMIHPDDRSRVARAMEDYLEGACERFESVHRMLGRDGAVKWVLARGVADGSDVAGRPTRLRGTSLDITDLRRTEQALLESAAQLEAAVRAANIGLWSWDPRTTDVYYSSQWKAQIGLRDDEVGSSFDEWTRRVHPDDLGRALAEIQSHVKAASPHYEVQFRMRHADGNYRWMSAHAATVLDEWGQVVRVLGAHIDLTNERVAESERRKLQNQLLHAQRLESVGRLAGGVAHDFNNMLSIILGHVELALEAAPPESELEHDLRHIREAGRRSAELTRQLLAFARRQRVAPVMLELGATVERMLDMLRRLIGEDITLQTKFAADAGTVEMDPSQVDQVLVNLVVNARDAIEGPGVIAIEVEGIELDEAQAEALASDARSGRFVRLSVRDDGAGIEPAVVPRVFEPFFTTRHTEGGTGIGLALAYSIVESHGGTIEASNTPEGGARVVITLPRVSGGAPAAGSELTVATRRRVLLVEDDDLLRKAIARGLDRHEVTVRPGGNAAIELLRADGAWDVILCDLLMPGGSGQDVYEFVRAKRPELLDRLVFLTGGAHGSRSAAFLRDLPNLLLDKPVTIAKLLATVERIAKLGNGD